MTPLYGEGDRAREYPIDDDAPHRSVFRRDYARILHSPAFRRLQGKTQLFPAMEHDFFRNRLTHSLEVAQIAKSIALRLNDRDSYFRAYPIDSRTLSTGRSSLNLGSTETRFSSTR